MPAPAHLRRGIGQFRLEPTTKIAVNDSSERLGLMLREYLAPATGFPLEIVRRNQPFAMCLVVDRRLEVLGTEGYRLRVRPDRVEIRGGGPAGLFYGIQTFRQLFPPEIYRRAPLAGAEWTVPSLDIEDRPRFPWRGLMLDVSRHFIPREAILKLLDLMALHKLNRFHWHLTDDQGWRLEIRKYPLLTVKGSQRQDTMLTYDPPTYSGKPHGGFYTREDVEEIVAYAGARHITIVPEIEMPGHAQAAIAAYPELGNRSTPFEVGVEWGVNENVLNVQPSTIQFFQAVLDEVIEMFPGEFIHVGGDEVPKIQWQQSSQAQEQMAKLGLNDEEELQSWFIRQMDQHLAARGRRLIGWDEILEGGLAPGAAVMSWRGMEGGLRAARAGHDVVMAPTTHTYFDYYQSETTASEPHAIGGFLPWEKVYEFDPVPPGLSQSETRHILGGQAQIWTEYIHDFKEVEYMAFPRTCALSETLWSPTRARSASEFRPRLLRHLARLDRMDVNYRKP